MAQYDVHRLGDGLVIDCQADLLAHIDSRFVVPLAPAAQAAIVARRLNPSFEIDGATYIMVTQAAAAVARGELGPAVASLAEQGFTISGAIDVLLGGV